MTLERVDVRAGAAVEEGFLASLLALGVDELRLETHEARECDFSLVDERRAGVGHLAGLDDAVVA